jgi:hypothetical protein
MFFRVILLSIILFISTNFYGQTILSPGDIAIISMNCDGTDDFSFVLLVPIANTTEIKFAESGWLSAGGFRGGGDGSEGTITWTANSALTCGTEVTISSAGAVSSSGTTVVSGAGWALSTSGDQILAYQGTSASPTFIYAINNDGAGVWQADATSTNNSALPTGLTNGVNAVAVNEADNVKYDCSTTTPVAATLSAISNNANWLSDNTTPYSLPINCGFTCTACVADSEPTTASSGLNFTNISCTSIDLDWTSGNGSNRIVVASLAPITGTPTDQTDYTSNSTFSVGDIIAAGEFVVYNGTGNSVSVTGLSSNTTYYFTVFEYNVTTTNCTENYFTSSFLNGNTSTLGQESEPTSASSGLNFTNIACFSMDLDWTSGNGGNRIVVASLAPISGTPSDQTDYTANNSFGAGNTIAAGEFVVYNGFGNSFSIIGLSTSTTYYFAVFEYNVTTTNCTENYFSTALTGNSTTIFCASTTPEITGILVAACGGDEGINEFFTFTNGTSSLDLDDLEVTFPSGGTYCNTSCGSGWVTNPTFVTQLNDTAACPGLFVEGNPIPANAQVIVFTGSSPTYDFNFSGLCGSGPYYAVFADNTTTTGRFGNYNSDCTQYRTLTVDFGGGNLDTATYQRCSLSNTGGDYVTFDAAGNPTYKSDG